MADEKVPPALKGEVWRGTVQLWGIDRTVVVADGAAHIWMDGWLPAQLSESDILLAYAEAMRARAEAAEARLRPVWEAAAWCDDKARAAQNEADAHEAQIGDAPHETIALAHAERRERCEGQSTAFKAAAERLRAALATVAKPGGNAGGAKS